MSPIMWKEFRQVWGWAALGFLCTAFGFAVAVRGQSMAAVLDSIYTVTAVLFPGAALLIGLAHVVFENRGDRWAFLTHRPVWPSALFLQKAFAGLVLYLIATGIPLVFTLAWVAVPSHFPAPFDWRMALPSIADLFGGSAYYFAGVLIGMRDARWSGSRVAGIGAPIICSFAVYLSHEFWPAIVWGAVGILITGVAALGTFIAGGRFETQPPALRLATGVSVGTGLAVALAMVNLAAIVFVFFLGPAHAPYKAYMLTPEGTIILTRQLAGKVVSVTDLEGIPIQQYQDPNARQLLFGTPDVVLALRPDDSDTYRETSRFFSQMQPFDPARRATWFYVDRLRLFGEYDNESGEIAGWLGPDGFSPGERMPTHRFECDPLSRKDWYLYSTPQNDPTRFLVCPNVVYRVRLREHMVDRLRAAAPGESILGAGQWGNVHPEYIAVSTTRRVVVERPDGSVRLAPARDPDAAGYAAVQVSYTGRSTFFSYYPAVKPNDRVSTPPIIITRFGRDQAVEGRYQLPFQRVLTPPSWDRVLLPWAVLPITSALVPSLSNGRINRHGPDTALGTSSWCCGPWTMVTHAESYSRLQLFVVWTLSLLASVVSAVLAYRRSRKYAFSTGRLTIWTCLAFVLGPIGFLLMICLLDWPVHEKCPACARMRLINRDLCEFCGAPFSPPSTDGTEILDLVCDPR